MKLPHPLNASEVIGKKWGHLKAFKENVDHDFCKTFSSLLLVCDVNKYCKGINHL